MSIAVTGSPTPIQFSNYDLNRDNLVTSYFTQQAVLYVGIPHSKVSTGQIAWNVLKTYRHAIMQEKSICPLTTESNVVIQAQ